MGVTLRYKLCKDGEHSFYLDICDAGRRWREWLDNLRESPRSSNYSDVKAQAEYEAATRKIQLRSSEAGTIAVRQKTAPELLALAEKLASQRHGRTRETWGDAIKHLRAYTPHGVSVRAVNREWIESYQAFLKSRVSHNTAALYYRVVKSALRYAHEEGYIERNPCAKAEKLTERAGEREALTDDELAKLSTTPMHRNASPWVRLAYMFQCWSSLGYAEMQSLKRSQLVTVDGDVVAMDVVRAKTKHVKGERNRIPLGPKAIEYLKAALELSALEGRTAPDARIFRIEGVSQYNRGLKSWAKRAGITKNVSSHVGRHTFATMLLNRGGRIEAVQKILGHSSTKTTSLYAKMLDKTLADAVQVMK